LVRTDSRREQSFETGEAGGRERSRRWWSRATGKRGFGFVKREPIVSVGTRRLRSNVGVGEIRGDKAGSDAFLHTRWITVREPVASRGAHDLCEGKALEREVHERLGHETRPWNSDSLGSR
jgi:hypothetical protein